VSPPIFISYSSKDEEVALTICRALEARGYDCWIAARNIGAGQNFQDAIPKALRAARLMLLVFTSNANNSEEIKKELALASQCRVTVIPVRVEDVVPNDAFAYEFATRQWINLFADWEREIERLVSQIASNLGEPATPRPEVAEKAARPARKRQRPFLLALPVVVIAAALGGIYLYRNSSAPSAGAPVTSAPSSPALRSQADERDWLDAINVGTVQALRHYMDDYPDGTHVADARARVQVADDQAFVHAMDAGTILALNEYVSQYATGSHVAQVKTRIAALERQAAGETTTAPAQRFDGKWQSTITCSTTPDGAQGYTIPLAGEVKGGVFHAERGVEGQPNWLTVDGKIELDGSGELYAHGLTDDASYTVGRVPPGSPYGYHITARFADASATGSRRELRPCTFTALKR
jgi:hypothetical protein